MKKRHLTILNINFWVFCAVFVELQAIAKDPMALNFNAYLSQVEQATLQLRLSDLARLSAQQSLEFSKSERDPRLNLRSEFGSRTQNDLSESEWRQHQLLGLDVAYQLFDFGAQSSKNEIARSQLKLKQLSYEMERAQIFWLAARAYILLRGQDRILELNKEQIRIAEKNMQLQERYYRQGLRPESDFLSAKVDFGRVQLQQQRASAEYKRALINFLFLLDPLQKELKYNKLEVQVIQQELAELSPSRLLKMTEKWSSTKSHLLMQKIELESQQVDAQLEQVKAQRWPSLNAVAAVQQSYFDQQRAERAQVQLELNWLIPWNQSSRIEQQKIKLQKQSLELEAAIESSQKVQLWHQAQQSLRNAETEWSLLQAQIALLERQKKLVRDRFDAGRASALELSISETEYNQLKLDEIRIINEAELAVVNAAQAREIRELDFLF
ncbi:MAG: TolC family protein [Oligoflexales bacterium]|nr:TolC family protein [Oligoflexales bacterium]